jgi:hypothetical protein
MEQKLTTEEICNKLRPVFGNKIDQVYLRYAMAENKDEREEIEHILNALYHKHLSELLNKKILLEPPERSLVAGEYPLATVVYADKKLFPFNLREKDWVRHVCISGMSGSGKTTMAFHIIKNFLDKGKPFLIFDWKKSFRPLLLVDKDMLNFTIGNDSVSNLFKININEPPKDVAPKEWINVLCDLIVESFFVSFGVHKVILETLDEAFKEWGVYNGSKNYPTWYHIKWRLEQKIEKASSRESTWLESALRIASVLTFGSFGKVLNYKGDNSINVEGLLNKKVIFELNSLGNIEKKFFCEFILTYIYKLKKAKQRGIDENFNHAILVDEAHNIFLKDKTHFVNESVTDMIYREMREYGTSLICLDQHISKLSDTVVGNSACHIAFQQQLPQDIQVISGIMQLSERKQFFGMLPVGSAMVKLAERYSQPFLIEANRADLRSEAVTDSEVATRMNFMFQVKELDAGKDEEFAKSIIDPRQQKIALKKNMKQTARTPKHALYNGELALFKKKQGEICNIDDEIVEPLIEGIKTEDSLIPIALNSTPSSVLGHASQIQYQIPRLVDEYKSEVMAGEGSVMDKIKEIAQEESPSEIYRVDDIITYKEALKDFGIEAGNEEQIINEDSLMIADTAQTMILTEEQDLMQDSLELNETEKILLDFIEKKIEKGWSISRAESFLEENQNNRAYSFENITNVINYFLEKSISKENVFVTSKTSNEEEKTIVETSIPSDTLSNIIVTEELVQKQKVYKADNFSTNNDDSLSSEQKKFIAFLKDNPDSKLSTVDLYKEVGLSARKGTKIKNQLMGKGLIFIKEERNDKGWKKIIQLKD